jgi:phosphoglycerate-specific signal transduction histidine kinase
LWLNKDVLFRVEFHQTANNLLKRLLEIPVRHRLVLGLSVLAGLVLCVAFVAATAFLHNQKKLEQITSHHLPALLLTTKLVHASEQLFPGAKLIVTAGTQTETEEQISKVIADFSRIDRILAKLSQSGVAEDQLATHLKLSARIEENFLALQATFKT